MKSKKKPADFRCKWMQTKNIIIEPESNGDIIFSFRSSLVRHSNPFKDKKIIWSLTRVSDNVFVLHPFYSEYEIEVKNDKR